MANQNQFFNAKNGIAVANTLVVDTSNNLHNIATATITTANLGTVNANGQILANASPLNAVNTRAVTGLANYMAANAQTTNVLGSTNVLSVTLNETGMYQVEGMILLGTVGTANLLNVGANIAFMNSGSFHYNNFAISYMGYANTALVSSTKLIINANAQTAITSNVANATNQADYIAITGVVNVSAVGTAQTQICAHNTANGNLLIMSNSYILWTKIG